ncbi:MAG: glycosyl transferase family 2, partial [Actinobacteria bacterium]|nr:glycosyl transferase family 2 [Actinomycetota bacterium]
DFRGNVMSYQELVKDAITRLSMLDDHDHPGVMVTFDNTARRQWKPDLWYGSNPYTFHRWLAAAASAVMDRPPGQRVVFINAWNEWAEGAVLEPNDRHGRTFLQAVRSVAHR